MGASASIVLKAGIDYSEHGLHRLHELLSVESGQSVVHLSGRCAQNLKNFFSKLFKFATTRAKPCRNAVSALYHLRSLSSCCPLVVQLLSSH